MSFAKRLVQRCGTALGVLALGVVPLDGSASSPVAAIPARRTVSPLDEPLRLLAESRTAYANVHDYTCTLVKRERINGVMQADNVVAMKARTEPFSVHFKWQEPKAMAGQEACYVAGLHEGKMRVKPAGFLGAVGFVTLAPDDPRAQQTSRRNITQAGIGNLIERVGMAWEAERRLGKPAVRIGEFEYNKRRCIRVETVNSGLAGSAVPCARSLIYFDKENRLPIRIECFDWPGPNGEPGQLYEVYSFVNLRLNVGLPDEVFNH